MNFKPTACTECSFKLDPDEPQFSLAFFYLGVRVVGHDTQFLANLIRIAKGGLLTQDEIAPVVYFCAWEVARSQRRRWRRSARRAKGESGTR
jgi:hypothetical protein